MLLDMYCILQYKYRNTEYEAGRENTLPPRGRGFAARVGSADYSAGNGEGGTPGTAQEHQPVLPVADRARFAAAHDAVVTRAAGKVFQGAPRLSGGRSRGLPHGTDVRSAHHRRAA